MRYVSVFILLTASLAIAEAQLPGQSAIPTPGRMKKPAERAVASANPYSRTRVVITRGQTLKPSPIEGRVGILGGISNIASSTSETEQFRGDENLRQNFVLGVMADVRAYRYFGVELDGFYGLAPKRESPSPIGEGNITTSLQHFGGIVALKGQLPLGIVVPKLGLGYGLMGLKHSLAEEGFTTSSSLSLKAPMALVGLDVTPVPYLVFTLDYARSLGGKGTYDVETEGLTSPVSDLDGVLFDRIRVGAFGRIVPGFLGGVQYTRRFVQTDFEGVGGSSPSNKEILSQITAVAAFEF